MHLFPMAGPGYLARAGKTSPASSEVRFSERGRSNDVAGVVVTHEHDEIRLAATAQVDNHPARDL